MSLKFAVGCDRCHNEIPPTKGFHLTEMAWIGAKAFKPGDFCIFCLVKMCGEKLMTSEDARTLKDLEEERYRRIDDERNRNGDW